MSFKEKFSIIEEKYNKKLWLDERKKLKDAILSRPVVLYGVGFFGAVIVRNFKNEGIEVKCFCDSRKTGIDAETGLEIISPDSLRKNYSDANIVISVANPSTELSVRNSIKSLDFPDDQIFSFKDAYRFMKKSRVEQVSLSSEEFRKHLEGYERAYNSFSDENSKKIVFEVINNYLFNELYEYEEPKESYFPEAFTFTDNEVFIDGGLYTGDTTEEFIKRMNGKYKSIIGFDIDEKNLSSARTNLSGYENIRIIDKGLWNEEAVLNAELGIMAGSNIKDGGGDKVSLITLDSLFENCAEEDYPTFIKLDIEGSEKEALMGAEKILKAKKPKLAVCVYHKPEDLYLIPELIKKLNPDYKFFMKHYSPYVWDTVLYAY